MRKQHPPGGAGRSNPRTNRPAADRGAAGGTGRPRTPRPPADRTAAVPASAAHGQDRRPAASSAAADRGGFDRNTWIYGRHAVAAALANPARRCRRLLALPETAAELQTLLAEAAAKLTRDAEVRTVTREELAALLPPGAVHQGLALAADPLPAADIEDVIDRAAAGAARALVVVLDQVSDPHNVGAVLRSAAAFGALALVVPEHGAPPVTGALAKAASGGLEHVALVRVVNLARSLDRLKEAGFWCIGLDGAAERSLAEAAPDDGRIVLVLGSEGAGLRRLTRERCDLLARLPTRGPVASLNVSNAAAVALYEIARRSGTP
jgi:23S rRNA (guanosine2251-2'-O)-methyltransferase